MNADGKAETRTVKPGPRAGKLWIIDQGVKPGERVIVEGALKVRDGMAVNAKAAPEALEPAAAGSQAGGAAGGGTASSGGDAGGPGSGGGAETPPPAEQPGSTPPR